MNEEMMVKILDLEHDLNGIEDMVGTRGGMVYDDMREDLVEMREALENFKEDLESAEDFERI